MRDAIPPARLVCGTHAGGTTQFGPSGDSVAVGIIGSARARISDSGIDSIRPAPNTGGGRPHGIGNAGRHGFRDRTGDGAILDLRAA
jgi:hypothetical protein